MPAPHPPEFRRRAINLSRQPGASVAQVAKDLGISETGLASEDSPDGSCGALGAALGAFGHESPYRPAVRSVSRAPNFPSEQRF